MNFDWNKYIQLGKELGQGDKPEYLRAAISRAYYGLYNRLRIYKHLTTKYRPHKELIDKLALAKEFEEEREISGLLQDLKKFREEADYDGIKNIDKRYAKEFWTKFDQALELFENNK